MEKIISKNYKSIPHFSFSKLGSGDHYCDINMEKIMTKEIRDYKDLIIVTEKLDGSNVGIIKKNDTIYCLARSGYNVNTSPFKQHHIFARWVNKYVYYFYSLLNEGERLIGEWLLLAHGTKYNIDNEWDLFVPLDIIDSDETRILYLELRDRINYNNGKFEDYLKLSLPNLLHIGRSVNINHIEDKLYEIDKIRLENCEGAVYRCEREGKFNFQVKYVRNSKEDGFYLKQEIYNYNWKEI